MKLFSNLFKKDASPVSTVDAMLVLCIHESGITVKSAAGDALRKLAKDALKKVDSNLKVKDDAYIRFGLLGSGATPGLPPGFTPDMLAQPGMPANMMNAMHALAGGKSLSQLEEETEATLPQEMKKLLQERNLNIDDYELRSFKESPDPGVIFLWIAAIRK